MPSGEDKSRVVVEKKTRSGKLFLSMILLVAVRSALVRLISSPPASNLWSEPYLVVSPDLWLEPINRHHMQTWTLIYCWITLLLTLLMIDGLSWELLQAWRMLRAETSRSAQQWPVLCAGQNWLWPPPPPPPPPHATAHWSAEWFLACLLVVLTMLDIISDIGEKIKIISYKKPRGTSGAEINWAISCFAFKSSLLDFCLWWCQYGPANASIELSRVGGVSQGPRKA